MEKQRFAMLLAMLFLTVGITTACELTLKVSGEPKETYAIGDVLVVEVKLVFTHRTCPVAVNETKFEYQGVKILGATEWKKVSNMEYTRKLKVQVLKPKKDGEKEKEKEPQITAIRTCEKEGGTGTIILKLN